MDKKNCKTPTKKSMIQSSDRSHSSSFELPDTPTSLASSNNQDVMYRPPEMDRQSEASSDNDLIQKWLQDRKRWDVIQQSYEQKVNEINTKLNKKTNAWNEKLEKMTNQATDYQNQIKAMNEQLKEYNALQSKYECLKQTVHGKEEENEQKMTELKEENARLKELEMTSQNMVERLLKRLEQQIHSCEDLQIRFDAKQNEHNEEIMRLEAINNKLSKNLNVLNAQQQNIKNLSECSSDSSLFTLSTVITATNNNKKYSRSNSKQDILSNIALKKECEKMRKENDSLRQTLDAFKANNDEWIESNKNMAKQTVMIERLKTEIMEKNAQMIEFEAMIKTQKQNIQSLEETNSQISMRVISEESMRQKMEKRINELEIVNNALQKKLNSFKHIFDEEQNEKSEMLLKALKNLLNEYSTKQQKIAQNNDKRINPISSFNHNNSVRNISIKRRRSVSMKQMRSKANIRAKVCSNNHKNNRRKVKNEKKKKEKKNVIKNGRNKRRKSVNLTKRILLKTCAEHPKHWM